jgi:hypothetical protein
VGDQAQRNSYPKLQSPPGLNFGYPGGSQAGPFLCLLAEGFASPASTSLSLGLQVRCLSIRTWLAQLVAFGGEVLAFSRVMSVIS